MKAIINKVLTSNACSTIQSLEIQIRDPLEESISGSCAVADVLSANITCEALNAIIT